MVMALTDKSVIPLNIHDLRVIEGEPRFSDGRLALRLNLDRRKWRQLIQRHEAGAQERGLGTLYHGGTKSIGGRPSADRFLTIEQTIYFVAQSDTKNALDVVAEVAKVVGALRRGITIPDTPWTDALFASDKPAIIRGDDNVVHIKHEEPLRDLFSIPPPVSNEPDLFDRQLEPLVRKLEAMDRKLSLVVDNTNELLTKGRRDPSAETVRIHGKVVHHNYGNKCPCLECNTTIMDSDGFIDGVWHHHHQNNSHDNRAAAMIPLAIECHKRIENDPEARRRFAPTFDMFQKLLKLLPDPQTRLDL